MNDWSLPRKYASWNDIATLTTSLAKDVADHLGFPEPPLDVPRPLAELAIRRERKFKREEFADALQEAVYHLPPSDALKSLEKITRLRFFLTWALDHQLEAALAHGGRHAASITYTPAEPFLLDEIDLTRVEALVFHVAGTAGGKPGDGVVTDRDWRRFAEGWRKSQPRKLPDLFHHQNVLFLGGEHPTGFVEFWIELASQLGCRSFWIGFSVFAQDPALAGFVNEEAGRRMILFDDSGERAFLEEFAGRWEEFSDRRVGPTLFQDGDAG